MPAHDRPVPSSDFMRRLGAVLGSLLALALIALIVIVGRHLLIFAFAGVLGAVLLHGAATWIAGHSPLRRGAALGVTVSVLLGLSVAFWWFVGPQVVEQTAQLEQRIPQGLEAAEEWLLQYPWGRTLISEVPPAGEVLSGDRGMVQQLTGAFSTFVDLFVKLLVVLTVALYGAANPKLYVDNALKLIPRRKRERGREVLQALARALRYWFLGQLIAMMFVGIATLAGMFVLGVPLALSLGLLAGLLEFIPYLGPFLAAVPILLVALLEGSQTALYVLIFFFALQQVESYLVTPLAQRFAVSMPPAILIVGQVLFGILFGLPGLIFAAPILVCVVVLIQMLYVEDVLGGEAVVLGSADKI